MLNGKAYVSANILLLCAYSDYRVYSVYIQLSSCIYQDSVYSVAYSVILINSANTLVYSVHSVYIVRYSVLLKCSYSVYSDLFKLNYSVSRVRYSVFEPVSGIN